GDIELLARHFLDAFLKEVPALGSKSLSSQAVALLQRYGFPGNVRELKSMIERAAYRDRSSVLEPEDVDLPEAPAAEGAGFEDRVLGFRPGRAGGARARAGGSQPRAARARGLSPAHSRSSLRRYGRGGRPQGPRRPTPRRSRARRAG